MSRCGDEVTISFLGDFDNSTTPLVQQCCAKVKQDDSLKRIILDFKNAKRVDTSAFACVINYIKQHKGSKTEVVVTDLHQPAKDLIEILKIEKIIPVGS